MIDDPRQATEEQLDRWVRDFDNWEVCDQCIMCLFDKTPFAWDKAFEWIATDTIRELESEAVRKRLGL